MGPAQAAPNELSAAEDVGRRLGEAGAIVVTGGLGGVMQAACRGARDAGGLTVGLLPGSERDGANPDVMVALPTGLGELRNGLIVRAADALIAVGGAGRSHGTLSEIALALKTGKPVVGLGAWEIDGLEAAGSAQEAVARALRLAGCPRSSPST